MRIRIVLFCFAILSALAPALAAPVDFHRDVRPILSNYCYRCHGPDAETRAADLRLDLREGLFGTASNGAAIVVPQRPETSELVRRDHDRPCRRADAAGGRATSRSTTAQIATTLRDWIAAGAAWQDHWAYRPPVRPELPLACR